MHHLIKLQLKLGETAAAPSSMMAASGPTEKAALNEVDMGCMYLENPAT